LYWALETLAWSEEHLSRAILVLAELAAHDPGGRWANRPDHSIVTILLPWYPQTTASPEIRIASVMGIKKHYPEIAWKILIELLPRRHQTSTNTHKPKFRNYIPKDWKEGVPREEYQVQVQKYAAMTIELLKTNNKYIAELVDNLENIPQPSYDDFLQYLSSDKIISLPDDQKTIIWEKICSLARKHREYSNAKWALPVKDVDLLEQVAAKMSPSSPEYLFRHLFSYDIISLKDRDVDWETYQEELKNQRVEALNQIYKINNIDSIIKLVDHVKNPEIVGEIFAHIIKNESYLKLLPVILDSQDQNMKHFIRGYIWTRYNNIGIEWIKSLPIVKWTNEQKCNFFLSLPFETEIWEIASEYMGEQIGDYWKKINTHPFFSQKDLLPAIENLLKYGRPRFAFSCIYAHYYSQKTLLKEHTIKALIDGISSEEPIGNTISYQIIEIIKILQNDPEIDEDDIFKIEWGYLHLFDRYNNSEPKLLEKYLSEKPDFFIEVIQLVYKSSKKEKYEKKIDEQTNNLIGNVYKLLQQWKRPPGKMDDGSFSEEVLIKWLNEVKIKTIESGHFEVAMNRLGRVLFYAGSDSNGLWIQQSVAGVLDDNENVREGFSSEIFNSRGAYFADSSGKSEKVLADLWKERAEEIEKLGLTRFATSLRGVARSYTRESERVVSDYLYIDEATQ
jgi:hypothetical protein